MMGSSPPETPSPNSTPQHHSSGNGSAIGSPTHWTSPTNADVAAEVKPEDESSAAVPDTPLEAPAETLLFGEVRDTSN